MMDSLRNWIFSLAAAAICLSILQPLIPKGTIRGIFRISSGLVLLVVALRPLLGFDPERLTLRYSDYQVEMDRQIDLRLADKILSPNEKRRYDSAADQRMTLLRLWVLKEAVAKLSGQGLRGYPNDTDFDPRDPRVQEISGCLVAIME